MQTEPQGCRVPADGHAVIEPRPTMINKTIPTPAVGTAHRLDLEEIFERDPGLLTNFRVNFWSQVEECEEHECYIWTGLAFQKTGYGRVGVVLPDGTKKDLMAHRVAFALANDVAIPKGVLVRHRDSCMTRLCCNPRCLYLGDYKGNPITLEAGT